MKAKRAVSIIISICIIISAISVMTLAASTDIIGYTNKYTYVRMAPYWTASVVDNMASGVQITIIERDYEYLYIQYSKDNITKRGYIPRADTDATGYIWCNHTIFNPGYNSTTTSQAVYYCPNTNNSCGSINADEGEVANKPLLVLKNDTTNTYAFVQYVTNTDNNGSNHVLYKRAWIPKSKITVTTPNSPSVISGRSSFYLKNVMTGLYLDLEGYSAGNVDGGNVHLWEFHGGYNQEWLLQESSYLNGTKYTKFVTNQGTQGRVLRVTEKTAVKGNNIDIYTNTSPSKEQEFYLQPLGSNRYYIKARCSGNYLNVGVDIADSGIGGEIVLTHPTYNSAYSIWELEPVYRVNYEYTYSTLGKIPSSIANGINATYNTVDICKTRTVNGYTLNFTNYTQNAFNSWNSSNKKITLSANSSSKNVISWSDEAERTDSGGFTLAETTSLDSDNSKDITMYYGSFIEFCTTNSSTSGYTVTDIPLLWQSTLAHELGHTLGLGHSPTGISNSVMSYSRGLTTIVGPQKIDFAAVKKNYSTK